MLPKQVQSYISFADKIDMKQEKVDSADIFAVT